MVGQLLASLVVRLPSSLLSSVSFLFFSTCSNQKWDCGNTANKVCPSTCTAYGESHYRTFDGKEFQFQGECDYVLVRSTPSNPEKFLITTSNVPCGSSGVTCTKSIDISIGDPFGKGIQSVLSIHNNSCSMVASALLYKL